MSISKRLRYEVLRRDDFACRYCGAKAPDAPLTVDHVQPVALGGPDEPSNLVTACADCNAGKSSSAPDAPIVDGVADDALRWANAISKAADIASAKRKWVDEKVGLLDEYWQEWKFEDGSCVERPAAWRQSIEHWLSAGVLPSEIADAMHVAMNKDGIKNSRCWRYFCGVVWRKLEARQDLARHLIETDQV